MKVGKLVLSVLMLGFLILATGCSGEAKTDENVKTIQAVIENALHGPNEDLQKLFNEGTAEDTIQYDKDHFGDYFANETAYMDFVNSYGAVLMTTPMREGYTFKVENIEFDKTFSEELIYDFTVELSYQKEGNDSWQTETVTGQANVNENHKIEDMLIRIDDFLGELSNK
ncbi:hypothetical protein MST22_05575 [Virgibacillus halodenitrificans]|uniref:hypothetical protein n=1 Tax=Virgibacillus halodenitrificans TaxID=1482 RepID=UPI00136B8DE5|nr:hypothetical protein [Virgibacillus halodenitrificans]MCJ0930618.1 hypothetical protein [Virgibacillus halodenitrificans]MYL58115.1 hypothetical protein [Virgibacillus halodenitrificans]